MSEEDRDIVEFTDEDGNTLLLEVLDSFYYNGEEYAVLGEVEEGCDCGHEESCEEEQSLYIMKVETSVDEDGDEVEEFVPVEDELMETLIEIVQTRFSADDEEDDDSDDEEPDGE